MTNRIDFETKFQEIEELQALAESGDAFAQNSLGTKLATGYYTRKDELGAFYWYCQAIRQGYLSSKFNAGTMLIHGDGGMNIDVELGMNLIEDAACYRETNACAFISFCFQNGLFGKRKDLKLYEFWKMEATEQNRHIDYSEPVDLEKTHQIEIYKPELKLASIGSG